MIRLRVTRHLSGERERIGFLTLASAAEAPGSVTAQFEREVAKGIWAAASELLDLVPTGLQVLETETLPAGCRFIVCAGGFVVYRSPPFPPRDGGIQ